MAVAEAAVAHDALCWLAALLEGASDLLRGHGVSGRRIGSNAREAMLSSTFRGDFFVLVVRGLLSAVAKQQKCRPLIRKVADAAAQGVCRRAISGRMTTAGDRERRFVGKNKAARRGTRPRRCEKRKSKTVWGDRARRGDQHGSYKWARRHGPCHEQWAQPGPAASWS